MEDEKIQGRVRGQEILIIQEQFGISKEGIVDAANATFDEVKITLKKIVGPHVFVENEQWSVIGMDEEFHARFASILQII
jgi:hypothetical protein